MTVSNAFQTLLARIEPRNGESRGVLSHVASVKSRLSSAFDVRKCLLIGSHSRGTSIRGRSDIDLFVVVSRNDARSGGTYVKSTTLLDNIKRELEGRFLNSDIYRDVHTITVDFKDSRVDVVPAFFAGTTTDN
jgi:tRNA nucleotidyltransferase (CCA-adding enzyme)